MTDTYLYTVLRLRLLVGFLGERAQFAWWPTAFFEAASHQFLEPVFVKTHRLAQYHGVVEAARRLHDEHLNVGSYHLFRLPEEAEQDLHALMRNSSEGEISGLVPDSKDVALDLLRKLGGTKVSVSEGPTLVGATKDILSSAVLNAIACAYAGAFAQHSKSYPYMAR